MATSMHLFAPLFVSRRGIVGIAIDLMADQSLRAQRVAALDDRGRVNIFRNIILNKPHLD